MRYVATTAGANMISHTSEGELSAFCTAGAILHIFVYFDESMKRPHFMFVGYFRVYLCCDDGGFMIVISHVDFVVFFLA